MISWNVAKCDWETKISNFSFILINENFKGTPDPIIGRPSSAFGEKLGHMNLFFNSKFSEIKVFLMKISYLSECAINLKYTEFPKTIWEKEYKVPNSYWLNIEIVLWIPN